MREEWIRVPYRSVVEVISGKSQKEVEASDGTYPIYGSGGAIGFAKEFRCLPGTTIIGRKGTINSPIYVTEKFWNIDTAFGLYPSSVVLHKFNYFFCEHFNFKKLDKSTAVPSLAKRDIQAIDFPLSPLPEQRAIVAKIEELFSSLDNGIANLEKAQEQLKVYRQAVLKKAFEGELTKEWREKQTDLPTAEELLEQIKIERENYYIQQIADWEEKVKEWEENGKEGKKPGKPKFQKNINPFTNEELSKLSVLPKAWSWVTIDKIVEHGASSLKAGPFGSSLKKEFYVEKGYKIYGQEQVIAGDNTIGHYYVNKEKYNDLINCSIKEGDVLISLVGTVGKILIIPTDYEKGIINPRLVKLSLNKSYASVFFKNYFESAYLKSLYKVKNHGTTMDVLNIGIIKELPYPLCSVKEQIQIVQEIESRLSVCDKVEESITEGLQKAKALKQSILKKAFDGALLSEAELEACRQEADWESAEVLLERIKEEKKKK